MRVVPVPCLADNYAYLIVCEESGRAAVVDPSEADPVLAAARAEGAELVAIWNTHHHWDHTGGNKGLLDAMPALEVVAHESDRGRVPGQTTFAVAGDRVELSPRVAAEIVFNPGHTSGAVSYYLADAPAVFTGDTLFLAGCGRLFEGTAAEMHASLSRLAALPDDTLVYCGHEYTAANLRFAAAVEPESAVVAERARRTRVPSVPGTIGEEKATNPFLRVGEPAVIDAALSADGSSDRSPAAVFGALRRWKDRF